MNGLNNGRIEIAQVVGKPTGGVFSCVLNFYRHIDREKFKFVFFTYEPSIYDEEIIALGGEVIYFPPVTHILSSMSALFGYFKKRRFDIVHVHLTTLSLFPLFVAKATDNDIRICHAHTTTNWRETKFLPKKFLRPFAGIFATHLAGCSDYANTDLYGRKAKGAKVIHNAVDLDRFTHTEVSSDYIVGTVGRLVPQKNHSFLIEVFKSVRERNDKIKLYLIGEGKLENKLRKKIIKNNLEETVKIFKSRADVEKFYDEISLFVLPSLYEGLPIVAVEAQAKGLSCFLSDKITRETAVGGNVKFLPLKKDAWATEIVDFFETERNFTSKGISSDYDIRKEVKVLENYYCEVLS